MPDEIWDVSETQSDSQEEGSFGVEPASGIPLNAWAREQVGKVLSPLDKEASELRSQLEQREYKPHIFDLRRTGSGV